MAEDSLRSEVEARVRAKSAPVWEIINRPRTDEDHRESYQRIYEHIPPAALGQIPTFDEYLAKKREEEERRPAIHEQIISEGTEQLTFLVLELRSESGETGPLTEEEFVEAQHRKAFRSLQRSKEKIRARLANDDLSFRKRAILEMLLSHAEEFLPAMEQARADSSGEGFAKVLEMNRKHHEDKMSLIKSLRRTD